MDLRGIDTRVLINNHSDVWHPNKEIRKEARNNLRKTLSGLHVVELENLIEWMRVPALLHMKEMCSAYLNAMKANDNPDNIENAIHNCKKTVEYVEWINDHLGVVEPVREPDYDQMRRKAVERASSGTLLAYY
ncbi:MAG: hypothetical protein ABIH11_00710 [Candidatus Altiarchaeota archaeon]